VLIPIDGVSHLLVSARGDVGRAACAAVGVAALSRGAALHVNACFERDA
jgi:hypothetical protein